MSAEGVTFIATINSAPTVEVLLRRAPDGDVVRPLSSEVLAAMKAVQQARFLPKSGEPDTTVTADDGDGGVITFKGFSVAPVLEQSKVSSSETANVVGVDSFLNGLGLSIYNSRPKNLRKEEIDKLFKDTPSRSTGNIGQLIQQVTDVLVSNLEATLDKTETESLKEVVRKKHEANAVALKVWKDILTGSQVDYPEWKGVFERLPKLGEGAAERIKELLQQRTSGFWETVNALGAEFLFFYRPKVDGSSGDLVRADKKVNDDNPRELDAGVNRYSGTDGSPTMLPLAGTIIYGPSLPKLRKEEKPYSVSTVVGQWPVEISAGYFQEMGAPAWLTSGGGGSFESFTTQPAVADPAAKKNLDPTAYKKRRDELGAKLVVVENDLTTILQSYAKVSYEDMRLADSTATLEIPLNFKVDVGVRYKFSTGEGGGSFTAFVRSLRHNLQLQNGNTLTSSTMLTLTHIQYE